MPMRMDAYEGDSLSEPPSVDITLGVGPCSARQGVQDLRNPYELPKNSENIPDASRIHLEKIIFT